MLKQPTLGLGLVLGVGSRGGPPHPVAPEVRTDCPLFQVLSHKQTKMAQFKWPVSHKGGTGSRHASRSAVCAAAVPVITAIIWVILCPFYSNGCSINALCCTAWPVHERLLFNTWSCPGNLLWLCPLHMHGSHNKVVCASYSEPPTWFGNACAVWEY